MPWPRKEDAMTTTELAKMPKTKLRKHLLAVPTIADKAWAPARGLPVRDPGETREAYIKRVLR
jgi:hypothetical protein